ncbi:MAG TPA: flagellar biosynthesis anti-sigma factor FlgM [Nitrospirota bacterium]|nr:flagellar biosynthesis anti-sigma factor FlgM [Nitrospirota bacterium]
MKIMENNLLNGIDAGKSSVIRETLSRTKDSKEINKSLASNDVHISGRALTFSKIRDVINRLPDVREDKIKSIGNDLLMGAYNVSSEHIASKLLSEHIIDTRSEE